MELRASTNRTVRTGSSAGSAADALCTVGLFTYGHSHRTAIAAQVTMGAFFCIDLISVERKAVEDAIDRTERAYIFAKWPIDEYGEQQNA